MFKQRRSFKSIISAMSNVFPSSSFSNLNVNAGSSLKIEKVLVISKLSRYEYERKKHKHLNDNDFERELKSRGTDFDKLVHYHNLHKKFENNIVDTFKNKGITVQVVNRFNYTEDKVHWADIIVPTGGDGTFLLAATKVRDNGKPVIGFNSDPNRSEGHLCLPKKYSTNVEEAIEKLQNGKFDWLLRSRIRIKLVCEKGDVVPKYLHEIDLDCEPLENNFQAVEMMKSNGKLLPVLALNEVFIGEAMSARVSHLQMRLNGSAEQTNMKCSGICICTGTGSTSWHLSINRLPIQSVVELLSLVDLNLNEDINSLAPKLADLYNKNLRFYADDNRMGYTIRDLISAGVWPQPKGIKSRGFAKKIEVKSNCFDARLVVDGGISFDFNDGTIVLLEINPQDSLRTVVLTD